VRSSRLEELNVGESSTSTEDGREEEHEADSVIDKHIYSTYTTRSFSIVLHRWFNG